jgi:hypothetical protein
MPIALANPITIAKKMTRSGHGNCVRIAILGAEMERRLNQNFNLNLKELL